MVQYLVIYPPNGKQKIGNCEVIETDNGNGIPATLLKQVHMGLAKVVFFRSGTVPFDGIYQEMQIKSLNEIWKWKDIKKLSDKDQTK